jgi:4-alpha-glucanotransferase
MIRLIMSSPADAAIFPVQDVLGLDNDARMNVPGTVKGNWNWRLLPGQLTRAHAKRLRHLSELYGRA